MKRFFFALLAIFTLSALSFAQVPSSGHVVVVVEENHSYSSVIGNSAMPYLNSLASKYGLATQYYANTHPSIGNYFMMTTGQIISNDDSFTSTISNDNIVRHLMGGGKTWKSYAEGLPYAGYTGGNTGYYLKRHNPFAYFSDVANSSSEKLNLVPFTQFAADLGNGQLPNFSFIVPNILDDAHDGSLGQADSWLQQHIGPLLASPAFQQDGILIITFDESVDADTAYGGGHVATVVIGPQVKLGYKSTTLYGHQSLLRTVMTALGMTTFPGAAANVAPMSDFFGTTAPAPTPIPTPSPTAGVTVSSPTNGATVASPVHFVASANGGSYPITAMRIYVDNVSMYANNAASCDTYLALAAGGHSVVVQAWNSAGQVFKNTLTITVSGSTSAPPPTTTAGVTISSPANAATVSSPVQIIASANGGSYPITAMRIYVDNVSMYTVNAASLNTSLALASGGHNIVINAWNSAGQAFQQALTVSVSGTATPPPTTTTSGVTISSPANGTANSSPVHFVASATPVSGRTIASMRIYLDYTSAYTVYASSLDTYLSLAAGSHSVIIQAWDNTGAVYKSSETISVP